MPSDRPLRVLHAPACVGGNPQGLARAERELGLASWSVVYEQTYIAYDADEVWCGPNPTPRERLAIEPRRFALLARALRDFDVVHLNAGQALLTPPPAPLPPPADPGRRLARAAWCNLYAAPFAMRDLPLLRRAGKAVVVTYQGDDARQTDVCRARDRITHAHELPTGPADDAENERRRRMIRTFDRHAHEILYLNPDLGRVLPPRARFAPYAHVDPRSWQPAPRLPLDGRAPVVVHAPTSRAVKGTRFLLEAVERLRAEGVELELLLIEGMTHAEARQAYARADLLVDQLLAGWYGGLAVECMALGVPVVCYLRRGDLGYLPAGMREALPLIEAEPATIADVLREWLTVRRGELAARGAQSRAFAERWHDPARIAAWHADLYRDVLERTRPGG